LCNFNGKFGRWYLVLIPTLKRTEREWHLSGSSSDQWNHLLELLPLDYRYQTSDQGNALTFREASKEKSYLLSDWNDMKVIDAYVLIKELTPNV